jgi:hypothetical protein
MLTGIVSSDRLDCSLSRLLLIPYNNPVTGKKIKVKFSPLQALEALRVVRG